MTDSDPRNLEPTKIGSLEPGDDTETAGRPVVSEEKTELAPHLAAADKDPIRVLLSFHHRIRLAFKTLTRLSRLSRKTIDPVEVGALYDFFATELAAHDLDEEASLLNRLARTEHPPRLEKLINACRGQHERLETAIEAALPHLQAVSERRIEPDPERLSVVRDELARILEPHLHLEEEEIFPMARLLLSREEQEAIYDEMIARRHRREKNHPSAFAIS